MLVFLLLLVRLLRSQRISDNFQQIGTVHRAVAEVEQLENCRKKAHVTGTWLASCRAIPALSLWRFGCQNS